MPNVPADWRVPVAFGESRENAEKSIRIICTLCGHSLVKKANFWRICLECVLTRNNQKPWPIRQETIANWAVLSEGLEESRIPEHLPRLAFFPVGYIFDVGGRGKMRLREDRKVPGQ